MIAVATAWSASNRASSWAWPAACAPMGEIERKAGKIQAVTSVHIARLEPKPKPPSLDIDEAPEDFTARVSGAR
jgi:hypothetical protein